MSALEGQTGAVATAYRLGMHDAQCSRGGASCPYREGCSWQWVAHVPAEPFQAAEAHLQARPRDAAGARLILHDGVCTSGCIGKQRETHARTQTLPVRVLRKVLAEAVETASLQPLTCLDDVP